MVTVLFNTFVNPFDPPDPTLPVTILRARLLTPDVTFVHPLGADVYWNNILVPEVNTVPVVPVFP